MAPTPAERSECLEQLRALENGHPIRCATVEGWRSVAVDVPGDVALVEAALARPRAAGRS
jgi:3-deoxy-manno-octulosonate cytidylyltransferase (CMP-KDO synthetase)